MACSDELGRLFAGADLEIDDLFLLESFQISYLPGWVSAREFSAVLRARPDIKRFLLKRCPEVSAFVASVERKYFEDHDDRALEECCDTVVWTIADILVYNKCPEVYDQLPFHRWDFREITAISDLTGKTVIDAGTIIHCPGAAVGAEEEKHQLLTSPPWTYKTAEYEEPDGRKRKYWKNVPMEA